MKFRMLALLIAFWSVAAVADEEYNGQTMYLPIYSHIWYGDRVGDEKAPVKSPVSVLISIRNTSLKTPIRILSARYYSTEGRLISEYLAKPAILNALGTLELFVERKESKGGSGANFVIQWDSAVVTNPPVVEALHADIRSGSHALIFVTTSRVINANK